MLFVCFVSSQIRGDSSQQVSFAQVTSCAMCYDVIYHHFAINSQYLKTWKVDSPEQGNWARDLKKIYSTTTQNILTTHPSLADPS